MNIDHIDLKLAEERMLHKFARQWKTNVGKKPKLRTYAKIKETYEVENYVVLNLERHQRSILAQLRAGILPLQVELGRFRNIKLEDRICTLCTANTVEDEYHMLFYCDLYTEERRMFTEQMPNDWTELQESLKLKTLFKNHSRKLSKYASRLLNKHQDNMFK